MAANEIAVTYLKYTRSRRPTFASQTEIGRRKLRSWILNWRQYVDADRVADNALMAAGDRGITLFSDIHGTLDARIAADADRLRGGSRGGKRGSPEGTAQRPPESDGVG
jgi:hypothetical protein